MLGNRNELPQNNQLKIYDIDKRPKQKQLISELKQAPALEGEFANKVKTDYAGYYDNNIAYAPVKWDLKKDQNEQGFASGVDDLARILLDNKSDIKFNKRLITQQGATYWVNEKNSKIPDSKKHWRVYTTDINKDGTPEVVITDSFGNIRYVNGWHLSKTKHALQEAHQKYIEDTYGNPSQIADLRRQGLLNPGQLSMQKFIYDNTDVDSNYPTGPLKVSERLASSGYKTRALNPCNLFMRYITKPLYDNIISNILAKNPNMTEDQYKWLKKEASIIKLNAKLYTAYVAKYAYEELKQEGLTDRQMKKKNGDRPSRFSIMCVEYIDFYLKNPDDLNTIQKDMNEFITEVLSKIPQNYNPSHNKQSYTDKRKVDNGIFNAESWINAPPMQIY